MNWRFYVKQSIILTYRFYYIVWKEKFSNPLRIYVISYRRYKEGGLYKFVADLNQEYYRYRPKRDKTEGFGYRKWIKTNEKGQRRTELLEYNPLVSVIVPTYNTEKKFLVKMLKSVLAQTYKNWELCIADDASKNPETIETLKKYEEKYANIKVAYRKVNGHICEASNTALALASGEYLAFLDHDDMLSPNALYEMVKKVNENRDLKLIYSDEDKIDEEGRRFDPHFKSGWNPDMFYSQNYISHLTFIQKDIIEQIGGFRAGYEGSQDYDLLLRSLEYIKDDEIDRVEKILYHWRAIKGSTAHNPDEKEYTHDAGLRALQDYFAKKDRSIEVVDGLLPNTYKVNYPLPEGDYPLVSILIPTKDRYDLLHKCVEGILTYTTYPNYEIIILDNETTCPTTLNYMSELEEKHSFITVLEYHKPFNYSAINNFGVKHAKGEIIALVNNDVEVISEGWLTEMVSHAIREEIGVVGAKLFYDDDTIQHAGVILGIGGVAGHGHKYFPQDAHGYFSRLKIIQNYAAVTGACMVMRKALFEEVDGFDEVNLKVAFNDVDLCLKILQKGYRNLWTPYAKLYHHESKSRGTEDTEEKKARFRKEVAYMQSKWGKILKEDPYYNINLTKSYENFTKNMGKRDSFCN